MSAHRTRGRKRTAEGSAYDISTGHNLVAPYEICINALGLLQFLVSFSIDCRSFTSLYNQSLKDGWDKIFKDEQERLKKAKHPNENSVVKCFQLNRLLHQYNQDSNDFKRQIENLRPEIDSRMIYTFPDWKSQDLFREVQRWRAMQRRRHLFYFNYTGNEKMPALPTLLMLQKAMTNWCQYLINSCRQNKNYWNNGGRDRFIELFEHSLIIVGQPTSPDGHPVANYTNSSFPPCAKLNARIICLLNPDILQNDIQLSNIGVTLHSLNQKVNSGGLEQAPIAWQTRQVMSSDGGPISILYAEVQNLTVNNSYSKRNSTSQDSNLCYLKFRMAGKVIFDLFDKNNPNPIFEHNINLTSQPFGICSHSQYIPDIVAKVIYYEIEQTSRNGKKIDTDVLTECVCRYQARMLGVKTKQHTAQYIKEVFSKVFNDVKNENNPASLRLLIIQRLAQLVSQIKFMVDYPVLAMMYDDGLFLGICNTSEVDGKLMGTPQQPQMLLRFGDLLNHNPQENPEIRCIMHNGTSERATFSKKAFIDDMCRFIYESAYEIAERTKIFSYSDEHVFHDFQWYCNQVIPAISQISPIGGRDYQPLIPVLWQSRKTSKHHANGNSQSQSNRLPTESLHSSNSNLTNDSLTITCTANQQDLQNNSTAITFDVKIATAVNIDPDVIVQYLKEKFQELCTIPNENIPQIHSIQPLQATTSSSDTSDESANEEANVLIDEFDDDQYGPLQTPKLPTESEFDYLRYNIPSS